MHSINMIMTHHLVARSIIFFSFMCDLKHVVIFLYCMIVSVTTDICDVDVEVIWQFFILSNQQL